MTYCPNDLMTPLEASLQGFHPRILLTGFGHRKPLLLIARRVDQADGSDAFALKTNSAKVYGVVAGVGQAQGINLVAPVEGKIAIAFRGQAHVGRSVARCIEQHRAVAAGPYLNTAVDAALGKELAL